MSILPKDLIHIIKRYQFEIEHYEKFKHCLKEIKSIKYKINNHKINEKLIESQRCKGKMECNIFLHTDTNHLEFETADDIHCIRYWCFYENKIIDFYEQLTPKHGDLPRLVFS